MSTINYSPVQYHKITVGELSGFIRSEEYSRLDPKPITPERAVSQSENPAARADDIALVYIAENNKLMAFAGILPDEAEGETGYVYSNSGWWVNPGPGGKYGLPVFLKAYQSCRGRMFFTDCSEYTQSILEKTGMFNFPEPAKGARIILRYYTGDLMRRKGLNRFISKSFTIADTFLNFLESIRIKAWKRKNLPQGFSVHSVEKIDEELNRFIKEHSLNYYLKQNGEKLNWIARHPWITAGGNQPPVSYPFSQITDSFKQEFLVVTHNDETVAVLMLSVRNHHASIPYLYYSEKHLQPVLKAIVNYLFDNCCFSLLIFQPRVLSVLEKINIPSVFKMKVSRYYGYSKALSHHFSSGKTFQDGEGDVAFT